VIADIVLIFLLLSGAIWGFSKGAVKALPSFFRTALPVLALGCLTQSFFKEIAAPISAKLTQQQALVATVFCYFLLGFLLRSLFSLPGRLLGKMLDYFLLEDLYRLLGGAIGFIRILVFLNALDFILRQWPIGWSLPVTSSFAHTLFWFSDQLYRWIV
jgi:uncharacterized membrane protein required for colicin V production